MVTCVERYEYRGLSTDRKPSDYVTNGAVFIEMDTGSIFFFNAHDKKWIEWISASKSDEPEDEAQPEL